MAAIYPYSFDFYQEVICSSCSKAFFLDLRNKGQKIMRLGVKCPYCDEFFRPSHVIRLIRDYRSFKNEANLILS